MKTTVFDPSATQFYGEQSVLPMFILVAHSLLADGTIFYFIFYISIDEIEKTFEAIFFSSFFGWQSITFTSPNERNTKGQFWTFLTMRNGDYSCIALLKMHYIRFGQCLLLLKKRNGCVALESFWGLIMLISSYRLLFLRSLRLFMIHGNRNTFLRHHVLRDYIKYTTRIETTSSTFFILSKNFHFV